MGRAGNMPLDRAHAHARWAERYDARGETQRAAAHFGRAAHYARMVHAFGAPKRGPSGHMQREADLENIVVGLWEDGAEAWYTLPVLHDLHYAAAYPERLAAATKMRRMQQVLHGHGPRQAPSGPAGYVYRELPDMLDALYASESKGITDSVHSDADVNWYIHRDRVTSTVYLVPARRAKDKNDVTDLVWSMRNPNAPSYTDALSAGLLIVQDQRPGRVQVQRGGAWEPATELETFAYYDFLLRYPHLSHGYQSEKRARELDEKLSKSPNPEDLKRYVKSTWTTFPSAYTSTEQNEAPRLAMSREGTCIFASKLTGSSKLHPDRISDVAWRLPS